MSGRTLALLLSAALGLGCGGDGIPPAEGGERPLPNFVVLVADDLGWADIGYHNPEIRTPNLDRLAAQGVELDQHYVQPQCTPTRVAFLTGRYPSRFGPHCIQATNQQAVPFGTPTLASALRSRGYATALVGKWHLGSKPEWGPNAYGFDSSYGSLAGAVGPYHHRYRVGEFHETWHRDGVLFEDEGHVTDLCAAEAVGWIEAHHDRPFFLYVPFHAVHVPLVEPQEWLDRNAQIAEPDRRLFAAALSHMDQAVGEIVTALERNDLAERTLVLFFSDNGGLPNYPGGNYPPPDPPLRDFSSNQPLRGRKTDVYEGGIRVPAFVSWPGTLGPSVVTTPIHAVDWMPTFLRLAGVPDPVPAWDGRDVWSWLTGDDAPAEPRTLYWTWAQGKAAVRHGDWKLVIPRRGRSPELYHLGRDPTESLDLAGADPERLGQLVALLEEQRGKDAP